MEIGIVEWLNQQRLVSNFLNERVFKIEEKHYFVLEPADKIISLDFSILPSEEELNLIDSSEHPIDRIVFLFGYKWYWTDLEGGTQLNILTNLGTVYDSMKPLPDMPFLGVHGKFELLNGSRDYHDWCKKAKFLGYDSLAIVERQTLAGTMLFQEACASNGIKPIIGTTAKVKSGEGFYLIKLLVKDKTGWRNLLKINKAQLVDNWQDQFIHEDELIKYSSGLVSIIMPDFEFIKWRIQKLSRAFKNDFYFQIDLTDWKGEKRDKEWIENVDYYLKTFYAIKSSILRPLIFQDAYYLDKIDAPVKKALNNIGKVSTQHLSEDQWFYSLEEQLEKVQELFEEHDIEKIFFESIENHVEIGQKCDFKIGTKNRYLPKYKMLPHEKKSFDNGDNLSLFNHIVMEGFENKVFPKIQHDQELIDKYLDRIEEESAILEKGNVVDYFLILSDICKWCKDQKILVGHGRGSAGGSLVSYLLDIIQIDPVEHDLLFSRFLTEGRLKGSLPDIDSDFSDRDAVVNYMKERYGLNYVASVGTYGNMKVKNAIKDFSRIAGVEAKTSNYITGFIKKDHEADDFTRLVEFSTQEIKFRNFFVENFRVFEFFDIILHQTRTASVHACATIIVPDFDEDGLPVDIHDLLPTKIMGGQLVTEWEGAQLEKAGFLKEDILGLKQLEKFQGMTNLILKNKGIEIDIYDIDMFDNNVYELFGEGLTEDVFQFGTDGLKGYCKYLKPNSISELTAANALYRPGAMESNSHIDFVKIKFGEKSPDYDMLLREVTEETYGLYIYQEQIMKAYSVITGANMEQADSFRKYITKAYKMKSKGIVDTEYVKYETEFIEKYCENGQDKIKAQAVWDKLVAFASYGFNKSHAAAYATISYISQWFKVNHPIEFWTTSLNEASDDDRPRRLAEIEKSSSIQVSPVDVNESELYFKGSNSEMTIYWSLKSVKWLGEKAAELIIEEREKNGKFFSLKEFINRLPKRTINKRSITNLIISGGFDNLYKVRDETERFEILEEFYSLIDQGGDLDRFTPFKRDKIWWQLLQTELTGFGGVSFEHIAKREKFDKFIKDVNEAKVNDYVSVAGIVTEFKIKDNKRIGQFALIKLNCNNIENGVLLWNESFEAFREELQNCENKILILNGQIKYDKYSGQNNIQSNRNTKLLVL